MKPLAEDTPPEVERILIEGWRAMTPAQKLRLLDDMVQFAEAAQTAEIRTRFPAASEYEVKMRVAARWLDADLMRRAFGWPPEEGGGGAWVREVHG